MRKRILFGVLLTITIMPMLLWGCYTAPGGKVLTGGEKVVYFYDKVHGVGVWLSSEGIAVLPADSFSNARSPMAEEP